MFAGTDGPVRTALTRLCRPYGPPARPTPSAMPVSSRQLILPAVAPRQGCVQVRLGFKRRQSRLSRAVGADVLGPGPSPWRAQSLGDLAVPPQPLPGPVADPARPDLLTSLLVATLWPEGFLHTLRRKSQVFQVSLTSGSLESGGMSRLVFTASGQNTELISSCSPVKLEARCGLC